METNSKEQNLFERLVDQPQEKDLSQSTVVSSPKEQQGGESERRKVGYK